MELIERISALIAYVPVVGWLYVILFQRKSSLAMFHVRQSIGLFGFLVAVFAAWVVAGWVLSWAPFGFIIAVVLFTLVITALIFGVIVWIIGVVNALRGEMVLLPIFGIIANRLTL